MAKMSEIRKKAQDKLRRKYDYRTNDNYGRGTILYKEDTESYHHEVYLEPTIINAPPIIKADKVAREN